MKYVELFSGCGGLGLGFEKAGFKNFFSIEFDKNAAKTYKFNFPKNKLIEKDIEKITNKMILKEVGKTKIDLIIGGPPCQGFSLAGKNGRKFLQDKRNDLFKEFVRFVKVIEPSIFVMENVASLLKHNKGNSILQITNEFKKLGYIVNYEVLNSIDFGIPQNRRRVFIVGCKNKKINFPKDSLIERKTIKDAIDDLPELKSGEKSMLINHEAMNHTNQMLEKMSYVSEGGNRYEIPENIRPKSGDARKYVRCDRNKALFTVTGDMRKVFHYSQNRALTPRELARIQSFPDSFVFKGSSISIQQQIGNAVPPILSFEVAKVILKHLKG